MKKRLSFVLICGLLLLGVCGCSNEMKENNNKDDESITLTANDKEVYDALIKYVFPSAYNPQAIRVISGNTLFGIRISGTNKVGGTITNCIDLINESKNYGKTTDCGSGYLYEDYDSDNDDYINISNINKKLEEYWKDRGM